MEIKSIRKAMAIIDEFSNNSGAEISVTELANRLKMTKSTVTRIMKTLASGGYLIQSEDTRKYQLGNKILILAAAKLTHMDLRQATALRVRELHTRMN